MILKGGKSESSSGGDITMDIAQAMVISTGSCGAASGVVLLDTENAEGAAGEISGCAGAGKVGGSLWFSGGDGRLGADGGRVLVEAGRTGSDFRGGSVTLAAGIGDNAAGAVLVRSGESFGTDSGDIRLFSRSAIDEGMTGDLYVVSGRVASGVAGSLCIRTGNSADKPEGCVITPGMSRFGKGGDVSLKTEIIPEARGAGSGTAITSGSGCLGEDVELLSFGGAGSAGKLTLVAGGTSASMRGGSISVSGGHASLSAGGLDGRGGISSHSDGAVADVTSGCGRKGSGEMGLYTATASSNGVGSGKISVLSQSATTASSGSVCLESGSGEHAGGVCFRGGLSRDTDGSHVELG